MYSAGKSRQGRAWAGPGPSAQGGHRWVCESLVQEHLHTQKGLRPLEESGDTAGLAVSFAHGNSVILNNSLSLFFLRILF